MCSCYRYEMPTCAVVSLHMQRYQSEVSLKSFVGDEQHTHKLLMQPQYTQNTSNTFTVCLATFTCAHDTLLSISQAVALVWLVVVRARPVGSLRHHSTPRI
jgi:hypothetical protein